MKKKIDELSRRNFYFNLTFMTRALTAVVTERALFEHIHRRSKEELLAGWEKLTKILDYLVTILPSRACIHSTPPPPLDEQRKIAHILQTADAKIAAEQDRKAALQQLFNSLLQALMTGRLRVNRLTFVLHFLITPAFLGV